MIVGLGNPGQKYMGTRHNVGFMAVDTLADRHGATWHDRAGDVFAHVAVLPACGDTPNEDGDAPLALVLAKPTTFMNRSGDAVAPLLDRLGVAPGSALIVYDDMDLPFGSLRLRRRGSAGTHNGMRSVVSTLGTPDIARLRLGISQPSQTPAIDHVLGTFSAEERPTLERMIARAADAVCDWAILGPERAMNRYNKG